jgi:two-component system, OmpR family, phosphate regulon response regulator PhoB
VSELVILCVDDEPEVRDALLRDLVPYGAVARVEAAEDVPDARAVVRECKAAGDRLALVLCDHRMPGEDGVSFLVELDQDPDTAPARKVLVTGQAGLEDTVRAVNQAHLDHYVAKPWTAEELRQVVDEQLTDFVLDEVDDLLPYVSVLDGRRILEAVAQRKADR